MAASRKALFEWDSRESPLFSRADRRVHFREKVLLSDLHLKDGNRGIILNISEQGLALQSARTLDTDSNLQLRFQLSQSPKWIEAEGRATWISASKHAAGVEFIGLSDDALIVIKNWMFTVASFGAKDELEMNLSGAALPQASATAQSSRDDTTESLAELLAEYVIVGGADEERIEGVENDEHRIEITIEPSIPEPSIPEPDFLPKPMIGEGAGVAVRWPARIAWILWAAVVASGFLLVCTLDQLIFNCTNKLLTDNALRLTLRDHPTRSSKCVSRQLLDRALRPAISSLFFRLPRCKVKAAPLQ